MKCDTGRLRSYADGELAPPEQVELNAHLDGCQACRAEMAALRERGAHMAQCMAVLDPGRVEAPDAARALATFQAASRAARPAPWERLKWVMEMSMQTLVSRRWRPLAAGVAAVLCLAVLFSFAPVRQVAADFLGIFRVRKFAVIPVDPSKTSQLESLAQLLDSGQFGEPTVVREPGEGKAVTNASEASAAAGFKVRVPEMLPAGSVRTEFLVVEGPAIHYEMDRAMMQAFVDAAGLKKVRLPDVEKVSIDVDVPVMVSQQYGAGSGRLTVVQLPGPEVNIPDGLDPVALGQVAFEFLGMPAADAVRLARTIDWTSTVVIPLPTDVAKYREVTVDGVSGLLLESEKTRRPTQAVLWQRDGIVHAVTTEGLDVKWALAAADSLR